MRFYLKDTQIDTFIKMVQNATIWDMKPVLAAQNIQQYNRMQGEAQLDIIDIQIIFELQARPNNLGHFVCVHYRANERKVYLYDSLKRRRRRTKLCTHFLIST